MKHIYVGQHVVDVSGLVGVVREIQDNGRIIVEYTKQVAWAQNTLKPYSPDEGLTDKTLEKFDQVLTSRGLSPTESSMIINEVLNAGLLIRERE